MDIDGRMTAANPAWIGCLGWQEAELVGMSLIDLVLPQEQELCQGLLAQVSKGLNVSQVDLRMRHKTGRYVWLQWNVQLTPDHQVCAVARDVSRSKQSQLLVDQEIRLLEMAEKTAHVGHWRLDIGQARVRWSQEMFKIYGRKPLKSDISLDDFIDAFVSEDRERLWLLINRASQGGFDLETECRLQRPDGTVRYVFIRANCEYDEHSQVVGLFGILQDVTESRTYSSDMKIKDDIFATAIGATSDGIWDWNLKTNEVWFSEQWKAQLGYQDFEVKNRLKSWSDLVFEEDEALLYEKLSEYLRGETERVELIQRLRHKKGHTVYVLVRAQAIRDDKGEPIRLIGAQTDVTELKNLENAKSEFTSIVSHELRTPLTALHGALGLLVGQFADECSDQALSLIEMANNNSQRLTLLVNDILDMEKLQSGAMTFDIRSVDVQALLGHVVETLRTKADGYQVAVEVSSVQEGLTVRADADRLMQVLVNLLSNAMKFSDPGASVKLRATASKQGVTISVIDTGVGVSLDKLPHIFDKFKQADSTDGRHKGGTGLGLAITKALVENMQGDIHVTSQEGAGSTFYVTLPQGEEVVG